MDLIPGFSAVAVEMKNNNDGNLNIQFYANNNNI